MLFLLTAAFLAVAVFGGAYALKQGKRSSVVRRARALEVSRGWTKTTSAGPGRITRNQAGPLDQLAQRLLPRPAILRARLEATGLRLTIGHYLAATAGVTVLVAGLLLTIGAGLAGAILLGGAAGIFLPHVVVGRIGARRSARFLKALPDAIGLIVRGLRAGLPIGETVAAVAQESSGPLSQEFTGIVHQVRLGQSLEDAMWSTARRLDITEFNFLVISLSVQRETGGNLAETLDNLGQILRARAQMRLKIKAMASEATASALIIGSLPFVMAVLMMLVSPDYLTVLITEPLGRMLAAGGFASLVIGALIMARMIRFEI
ncbi:type II secretion system F family protein [Altericroceibacterium xinjiangense]|uniref:type II secretion system F family protein n=1 Tax=Altericroceibacterium xinjiangense TaxID=762261 RepID=UPI000F7EA4C5|nr:type II secretion system F family protein [Altericroceibacterium xinjiangense]